MVIEGHETVTIEGQEYLGVGQIADLTNRTVETIYALISRGNRIRKMKSILFFSRRLVPVEELFEFPFVICGRPCSIGIFAERFILQEDKLIREEYIYK